MMKKGYSYILLTGVGLLIWVSYRPVQAQETLQSQPDSQIEQILSRDVGALTEKNLPDGAVQIDMNGGFGSVSVARIKIDGELETACVTSMDALEAFQNATPIASEKPSK